jgi:UDP-glucose 4-epimerase
MTLDTKKIDQEFKEYYYKNISTATHIFIYSESQSMERAITSSSMSMFNLINGKPYTEMRSRDAKQEYVKDAIFVAVGTYEDIND